MFDSLDSEIVLMLIFAVFIFSAVIYLVFTNNKLLNHALGVVPEPKLPKDFAYKLNNEAQEAILKATEDGCYKAIVKLNQSAKIEN